MLESCLAVAFDAGVVALYRGDKLALGLTVEEKERGGGSPAEKVREDCLTDFEGEVEKLYALRGNGGVGDVAAALHYEESVGKRCC